MAQRQLTQRPARAIRQTHQLALRLCPTRVSRGTWTFQSCPRMTWAAECSPPSPPVQRSLVPSRPCTSRLSLKKALPPVCFRHHMERIQAMATRVPFSPDVAAIMVGEKMVPREKMYGPQERDACLVCLAASCYLVLSSGPASISQARGIVARPLGRAAQLPLPQVSKRLLPHRLIPRIHSHRHCHHTLRGHHPCRHSRSCPLWSFIPQCRHLGCLCPRASRLSHQIFLEGRHST